MVTPEAALKLEIARLTGTFSFYTCTIISVMDFLGAINRHRSGEARPPHPSTTTRTSYVNPSYKPPSSKPVVRPGPQTSAAPPASSASSVVPTVRPPSGPGPSQSQPRDVTINGVVFETSKRSLVRKDSASVYSFGRLVAQPSLVVKPSSKPPSFGPRPRVQSQFSRNKSQVGPRARVYKPKGPPRSRLKLDNTRRSYQSVH
jgi:hypothetical protein